MISAFFFIINYYPVTFKKQLCEFCYDKNKNC